MNAGLELALVALGVFFLFVAGIAILATFGAGQASRAEERSRSYLRDEDVMPLTEAQERRLAKKISDGLVEDFHVVRDAHGDEHIVPTKASPPDAAEGGSPTASQ